MDGKLLRDGGRRDHEIAVIPTITTRYDIGPGSMSLETTCDTSAPVRLKITPAYAHSFNRGKRGMARATAPRSFQTPKMTRRYEG